MIEDEFRQSCLISISGSGGGKHYRRLLFVSSPLPLSHLFHHLEFKLTRANRVPRQNTGFHKSDFPYTLFLIHIKLISEHSPSTVDEL
ncbi:predicted protein [Arabidopsis lyrata subsp. lyrata]|uniref:Predicted protein n=1 Tax=Arabidopsis lyrata subsp. lyrata TaxID=81972 RepID=D7LMF0_ARALL|nr:predicted protein [Arabidopsis lyrata subsp. lyrata]